MSQSILNRNPPEADSRIWYGQHALQFVDLRLPKGPGPHPAIVSIHGGFWRNRYSLSHLGHLCAALTALGFATWSLEYRRVGDAGGWPGTFHDVSAGAAHLFRHAADFAVDPARIGVLGHSAGGQLASWLASMANVPVESPIRTEPLDFCAVVPMAGVLDLRQGWSEYLGNGAVEEFIGGPPEAFASRYDAASPMALVPSSVPHLVVHGAEDEIVPVGMSERYVAELGRRGQEASLLRLEGADHFDVIDPNSAAWPVMSEAIVGMMS
ncbi:MAG: alpha/beta hydrolase [Chloroflexota bacterium]|nr:alpha/beta hydrolase [Chloroflexota bacterium]